MSDNHKISEFIDGISFRKTVGGGLNPDDVYDSICQLTSLYNSVLAESYSENDELKKRLEEIAASTKSGRNRYFYSDNNDQTENVRSFTSDISKSQEPEYTPKSTYKDIDVPYSSPSVSISSEDISEREKMQREIDKVYKAESTLEPERKANTSIDIDSSPEVDFRSAFGRDYSFKSAPEDLRTHSKSHASRDKSHKQKLDKQEKNEQEIRISGDHSMSGKELRRLKRGDLLELLIEQSRETARLKDHISNLDDEVNDLYKKLSNRTIKLNKAGTIAEASFLLNDVLESTEAAAAQYLENLKALNDVETQKHKKKEAETEALIEKMLADAKEHCDRLMKSTEEKCNAMTYSVKQQCDAMRNDTLDYCESIENETRLKCEELEEHTKISCENRERQTAERCRELDMKTQQNRAKCWEDVSKRMDEFYKLQDYFRVILGNSDTLSND